MLSACARSSRTRRSSGAARALQRADSTRPRRLGWRDGSRSGPGLGRGLGPRLGALSLAPPANNFFFFFFFFFSKSTACNKIFSLDSHAPR